VDQHDLVKGVKDLALELGRTPTRDEFEKTIAGARYQMGRLFGNYSALLKAAGLETYNDRRSAGRRRIGNEIFERDVSSVLEAYQPRESIPPPKYTPTLVIPDCHFPFVSTRVLDAIYEWARKEKPKRIVQLGDLYDQYSHAKFPRSLNVYLPKQEEELARKGAEAMWATLQEASPGAECIQLKGNHDVRMMKRTLELQPALEHAVSKYLDELMTFPGVTLVSDSRQEYIVEGIEFIHGYRSRLGEHRDHALMNAVVGHIHVGGCVFRRIRGQTLWELNAGLAGDPESKALSYTPQRITNWTPGFGWIDESGPRFIPV
jgi:hypothetical protein